MWECGFADVFQNSDHAKNGSRIDSIAERFVIEADVAASDGNFKLFAGFGDPVNDLRKLPHDVRLLGIAEVQAVRRAHGSCAGAGDVTGGFRDGVHCTKLGVEVTPAAVAIERHRERSVRTFDANDPAITGTGALNGVGLDHGIVLLINPSLAADIFATEQTLEIIREVGFRAELHVLRHVTRDWRFPSLQRTAVHRGVVGECGVRNIGHNFAVFQYAHSRLANHATDFDSVESPFAEYFVNFLFAALLRH